MSEAPYIDPLIKARDRGIETIAVQLNTVRSLAQTSPPQLSPGDLSQLLEHIEKALEYLDGVYTGPLPEAMRERQKTMKLHLESAHALAEEHLAAADAEGKARLEIKRAVSCLGRH